MKKYRPYSVIPDDILGKAVTPKTLQSVKLLIISINGNHIETSAKLLYDSAHFFDVFTFLDGTPCGEECEELPELVHDEVYLVRLKDGDAWRPRYFNKFIDREPCFYSDGMSEKTANDRFFSAWGQVSKYDCNLINKTSEPKSYLYKIN